MVRNPITTSREKASDNVESRFEKRLTRYVDNGNLMCLTENYPLIPGDPRYFMTLDEASKAINSVCMAWQYVELNPSAKPGFKNTYYILDDVQDHGGTNITISVTYNGGKTCPSPPLNFWIDRNLAGDGQSHCLDRLYTIINGCMLYIFFPSHF
jgi:hypothetical protein